MPPIQQATLSSPDKKFKTVVTVGSPEAATLQSKGWGLGDIGASVLPIQKALSQVGTTVPQQTQPVTPAVPPAAPEQQPAAPVQQPVTQQAPAPTQPQQPAQQTAAPAAPAVPAPTAQQATLQSPDGMSKVVVGVGSQEASQLQSQGWKLGAPANASVVTAQQALGKQQQVQQQMGQQLDVKQAQEVAPTFDWEKLLSDTGTASLDQTIADPITTGLLERYGVTPPSAIGNPVADYADTYNKLLTSMGLMDVKSEFTKVQEKYAALQNELNDKISEVNDDPWLSEGLRVGRIKSLQEKYQGKLQILNDQQKLYDAMYQQGVQQAQYVANAAYQQQQFNTQTAFNVANLALKEQEAKASLNSAKLRDKLALAQEMRMRAAQDSEDISKTRGNSLAAIKTLADIFGGSIFDSLPASERRKWEQNAGLPEGTMDYLGRTLDEQKLAQTAALASAKTTRGTTSGGTSTGTVSSGIVTPAGGELKLSPEASAVINNTLRLEDLTPTVRGKIAGELERAGYKSGPKLSSGQQDDIATGNTTIGLIDQILKYNEDGKLEGVGGFYQGSIGSAFTKLFGIGSKESQDVRALIGNVRGTIAKLRGGTSFTTNEQKLLDSYVPTINESPASVINKLNGLKRFIESKNQNLLQSAAERGVASVIKDLSSAKNKYNLNY